MQSAIETLQLTRIFGSLRAVDQMDLSVPGGTFFGFLGPNGAGKSTTIKMLTGLLAPSSGSIRILGLDPALPQESLAIKRRIGVVPDGLALFDNLTGPEYLTFVGRMHLLPQPIIADRTRDLLQLLRLDDAGRKLTIEYSHGMKKKLALAAALLPNPDLLFLDEPFEGVDAVTSRVIKDTLASYVGRGSTVFLTSHVLDIVEKLCTHVGIIVQGRLVDQAPLDEIRRDGTLEQRFLAKVGADGAVTQKLPWLEAAS